MADNQIKKIIKKLQSEDKYLSGIYNYCDRWCERCAFTDRCLTYSTMQDYPYDQEENGEEIEDIMNSVLYMFKDMIEFLKEEAVKRGIDLNEPIDLSVYKEAESKAESHPLGNRAYEYFELVHDWFESREELMSKKGSEFVQFAELGFDEEKIENNLRIFQDAVETIQWYFTMIRVKIIRALRTKFESELDDLEINFEQVNTSAKIALIGCEKSLSAWQTLYEQFSEDEDKILQILSCLDGLRKDIMVTFPDVTSFKRPYFD